MERQKQSQPRQSQWQQQQMTTSGEAAVWAAVAAAAAAAGTAAVGPDGEKPRLQPTPLRTQSASLSFSTSGEPLLTGSSVFPPPGPSLAHSGAAQASLLIPVRPSTPITMYQSTFRSIKRFTRSTSIIAQAVIYTRSRVPGSLSPAI